MNWDRYFLELATLVAEKSKDPSTKVGAVVVYEDNGVCSTGFNGFPRGTEDGVDVSHRYERPEKYLWTEHAERNAIYNAAKQGHSTEGCTLYVPLFPCSDCARAIIQAGIRRLVTAPIANVDDEVVTRWKDTWLVAAEMLDEAGVIVDYYE